MNPVYDSSQEIHLISSKAFGLFFEQWSILVDDILICRLKILLGSSFIRGQVAYLCGGQWRVADLSGCLPVTSNRLRM